MIPLTKAFQFFIFSNIYVAFPVTCLSASTFLILHKQLHLPSLLFIYFSTLFLYSFHRAIGVKLTSNDKLFAPRLKWAKKNIHFLFIIILTSGIIATYLFWFYLVHTYVILLVCASIALGYSIPLFKIGNSSKRLRDYPFLKLFLIASIVSIVVIFIPVNELSPNTLFLYTIQLLFLIAITIPFDIRDIHIDTDIKTLPNTLGVRRSKIISITCLFAIIVLCFAQYTTFKIFTLNQILPFILTSLFTVPVVLISSVKKSEFYFNLVVEGTMILQFLLIYFFIN